MDDYAIPDTLPPATPVKPISRYDDGQNKADKEKRPRPQQRRAKSTEDDDGEASDHKLDEQA